MKRTYLLLLVVLLGACNEKMFLTPNTRYQIERKEVDLKLLQFYNDKEIRLVRYDKESGHSVRGGVLVRKNASSQDEVIIRPNTRGVCTETKKDRVEIAFESEKNITFVRSGDAYFLEPDQTERTQDGKVNWLVKFGEEDYYVAEGKDTKLFIYAKDFDKYSKKAHVARGVKIGGR
jgi:hypothetical protein